MSDQIFLVNSSSFNDVTINNTLVVSASATVDFSAANYVSGTFTGIGIGLSGVTASYINVNVTASISETASYIKPGATFYLVSGSDGYSPAYIEPYDYCTTESLYRPPFKEGRMVWDHKYIDYAHYMDKNWRMHLGKEVTIGVYNPTAVTMSRMTAVYISGSSNSSQYQPDVYPAIADGTNTKNKVIGVIRNDIGPNETGFILMSGVMHRTDMTSYGNVGTVLYLSPSVEGGLTATKPGQPNEVVQVGYVSEAGTIGSFICSIIYEPVPANAYAGMTTIPLITDNTASFTITISTGSVNLYNNAEGIGAITQYPLTEVTFSLPASLTASYVYATTNGTTASYAITNDFNNINGTSQALVTILYRADEDTHWLKSKEEGLALANKLNLRLIETEKFKWESGFSLYTTGSNYFVVTAGSIWFGATNISQEEFDSRNTGSINPKFETHFAYHSASNWSIPIVADGKWNNSYYDDGTNLVSLAPLSWSVNYFYRILGENPFDEDVFYLISNYEYSDFAAAQADILPSDVPVVLSDVALLVGRIIFQSGSTSGTVESAITTNFGQSSTSQHNSLAGIQGGIGGEYYHLSFTDYVGNGTGLIVRTDDSSLTNVHLTGSLLGTSSWANNSKSSSYISSNNIDGTVASSTYSTYAASASWSSASISSSYAETWDSSSIITYINSLLGNSIFYFTETGSGINTYYYMRETGSSFQTTTLTTSSIPSGEYAFGFIMQRELGTTVVPNGLYNTNILLRITNAAGTTTFTPELYLINDSNVEYYEFPSGQSSTTLTTEFARYIPSINIDAPTTCSLTDRLILKLKSNATAGAKNYELQVGGNALSYFRTPITSISSGNTTDISGLVTKEYFSSSLSQFAGTSSFSNTASWAINAINGGTTLSTGSTYPITASWSVSASWSPQPTIPTSVLSASWVSASVLINSASYANTSSWAINAINGGTTLGTGSTYPITASWAISASWSPSTPSDTATSASWVSSSVFITTAQTASYILASNIDGTVLNATQAIYSTESLNATNSINAISASYTETSSYSNTSSYALNAVSQVDFSRGGVFFDAGGIAGTYATASSLVVWRAPFACNATQLCAYRVTGSTAIINAERNNGNLLTASYTIATTGSWHVLTALQSRSFSIGDTLEITLISSSGFPTQIAIQIDMQRA